MQLKKNKVLYSDDIIGYLRKSRNSAIDLFEWKRKFIKMTGNKKSKVSFYTNRMLSWRLWLNSKLQCAMSQTDRLQFQRKCLGTCWMSHLQQGSKTIRLLEIHQDLVRTSLKNIYALFISPTAGREGNNWSSF